MYMTPFDLRILPPTTQRWYEYNHTQHSNLEAASHVLCSEAAGEAVLGLYLTSFYGAVDSRQPSHFTLSSSSYQGVRVYKGKNTCLVPPVTTHHQ